MNKTTVFIFGVVTGAVVGAAASWKLLKTRYEAIADAEIAEVKAYYASKNEPEQETKDKSVPDPTEMSMYEAIVYDSGYKNEEETEGGSKPVHNKPYTIAPNDFGDKDYDLVTLTYFADGILADENNEIIHEDDIDDLVGDAITHFGEYEDDAVYVRDDTLQRDYEIIRDLANYHALNHEDNL